MKSALHSKVAVVLIAGLGAAVMTGGSAYAYWTTSGSGTGTASASSSSALTSTGTADITGLYPTATDLPGGSIAVTNPNAFKVAITSSFGSASTGAAGCGASAVTFAVAAGAPTEIGPGATATIPYTASMSNAAENACQGAVFTATLTVSGQSVQ